MAEHPLANHPRPPPRGVDLPSSDGVPMETARHRDQMILLLNSLGAAWRDRTDYYAGGDMFVYFSETQARNNDFRGPDVFVVTDTERKERDSWVVWEEDGRTPDVVIELLSPSTEAVDRGVKMNIYARVLKVAAYYLYDPFDFRFEGFRLDPLTHEYHARTLDADGSLPCEPLGLRLAVRQTETDYGGPLPMLRWLDADGVVLPTEGEMARAAQARADEAQARAEDEQARADALQARVAELERKLAAEGQD